MPRKDPYPEELPWENWSRSHRELGTELAVVRSRCTSSYNHEKLST